MIALRMEDNKKFTSELFVGQLFDRFLVREAVFVTFTTFTIDGRVRQGYFTEQEAEEKKIAEFIGWEMLKPFCYTLIRGKKLPESFRVVFQLPPAGVARFVTGKELPCRPEQVKGLYLNVRYEEGTIDCVTGTSVDFFTLDKSLDYAWDEAVRGFFRGKGVPFTEG